MFNLIFILIFSSLSSLAVNANNFYPTVPDCVINYTSFIGKYADEKIVNVISNYSDISGNHCGNKCNSNENCTSFNYYPSGFLFWKDSSKCHLISNQFNHSFLENNNELGYYLKGNNDCSESEKNKIFIFALLGALLLISICLCCYCCHQNKRYNYQRIN